MLRLNQKYAFKYSINVDDPALFMEMRLGKTLVSLRWSQYTQCEKMLIIGPYSVYKSWLNEISLENRDGCGLVTLFGSLIRRKAFLKETFEGNNKWFFLNTEALIRFPEIDQYPWDTVIIDESTCLRNPQTKLSKYCESHFRHVKNRAILTGTPIIKSELEYYMQLRFLNPDIFPSKNYWEFRAENFNLYGFKPVLKRRREKYVLDRLNQYCFFQTRKEVNLNGIKIQERRYIPVSAEMKKVYQNIVDTFLLEYRGCLYRSTVYAPTIDIWLRRLCGGMIEHKLRFKEKLNELQYLLTTELSGQSIIIWCHFTQEIEFLFDYFKKAGFKVGKIHGSITHKKRYEIIDDFNTSKIELLFIQPACVKFGTRFTSRGTSTMIFYSLPSSTLEWQQAQDRFIDVDKPEGTLIIYLLYENTVDEDFLLSLLFNETPKERIERILKRITKREELQSTKKR